jgi:hypothetical protein
VVEADRQPVVRRRIVELGIVQLLVPVEILDAGANGPRSR